MQKASDPCHAVTFALLALEGLRKRIQEAQTGCSQLKGQIREDALGCLDRATRLAAQIAEELANAQKCCQIAASETAKINWALDSVDGQH